MRAVEIACEQYSDEWWEARKGLFTASQADKLVTPTGRVSTQWKKSVARTLAEMGDLQEPKEIPETYWMARGSEMEEEAANWLSVEQDRKFDKCGIFTDSHFGASPDRVVRRTDCTIPVEIKCPSPATHIDYLLEGGLPKAYLAQVQFQIALLDAPYGIFMSYHPELEPLIAQVERDDTTELVLQQFEAYRNYFDFAKEIIYGT